MTWLSDNIMAVKAEKLYWGPAVEYCGATEVIDFKRVIHLTISEATESKTIQNQRTINPIINLANTFEGQTAPLRVHNSSHICETR